MTFDRLQEFTAEMRSMLLGAHEALISSNAWLVARLKTVEVKSYIPTYHLILRRILERFFCWDTPLSRDEGFDGASGCGIRTGWQMQSSTFDFGALALVSEPSSSTSPYAERARAQGSDRVPVHLLAAVYVLPWAVDVFDAAFLFLR